MVRACLKTLKAEPGAPYGSDWVKFIEGGATFLGPLKCMELFHSAEKPTVNWLVVLAAGEPGANVDANGRALMTQWHTANGLVSRVKTHP